MTTVSANGVVAEVDGEGFPVVMIHGLGGTSNTFQPQIEALRDRRVIRLDLPGSGRSPVPQGALSIEGFVEAVLGIVKLVGATRADFVGHSLGTIVCQAIAAEHRDIVRSLTLLGALAEPAEATRTGLAGRAETARREGMAGIADQIVANALSASTRAEQPATVAFVRESLMRQNPEGYARTCEALGKATAVDSRLVAAPALLITGNADTVNPVSVGQQLADRLPDARLAMIDRGGHWLTVEKTAETNRRMSEFMKQVEH